VLSRPTALLLALASVAACGEDGPPRASGQELVFAPASQWQVAKAAQDPFDDRPGEFECTPDGAIVEELSAEDVFAVYTERCAYVTASQTSATRVYAGDTIQVRLWNFRLFPRVDGQAHIALAVEGQVAWEERLEMTGGQAAKSGLRRGQWKADRDLDAGVELQWHLHNHGANEWALFDVLVLTR
jgi:predicted small lipoprotein YifL